MKENIEESKLHEPTMKEMNSLRKDINKMTHKDRILMVNKILENVGTKTLFVYEEPNYYVEKAAQELLEDWIENDYKILKEEYEVYIKEYNKDNMWKEVSRKKKEKMKTKKLPFNR